MVKFVLLVTLMCMGSLSVSSACEYSWYFPCKDGSECVPSDNRCDGSASCVDGSDEEGCDDAFATTAFSLNTTVTVRVIDAVAEMSQFSLHVCGSEDCSVMEVIGYARDGELSYFTRTKCFPYGSSCWADGTNEEHGYYSGVPQGLALTVQHRQGEVAVWPRGRQGKAVVFNVPPENARLIVRPGTWNADVRVQFYDDSCGDQWPCSSGGCIDGGAFCDGTIDCTDGSDEDAATCGVDGWCPSNTFRCDGSCIKLEYRCDGVNDCTDGADEDATLCSAFPSVALGMDSKVDVHVQYDANNHQGIEVLLCGSKNCSKVVLGGAYTNFTLHYATGTGCNAYGRDCTTDVNDSVDYIMAVLEVQRRPGELAVWPKDRNQVRNVAVVAVEDDWETLKIRPTAWTSDMPVRFEASDSCTVPWQWQCASGECIDGGAFCDGTVDCADSSDEDAATCDGTMCPLLMFRCRASECVDLGQRCDGAIDCINGADEDADLCSSFPSTILPAGTTLAVSINNSEETLPAEGESQVARPMNVSVGIVLSFCGTQNCSLLWVPFPGSYVAMLCPLGVPGSIYVFIFGPDKRCSVLDVYIPDTQDDNFVPFSEDEVVLDVERQTSQVTVKNRKYPDVVATIRLDGTNTTIVTVKPLLWVLDVPVHFAWAPCSDSAKWQCTSGECIDAGVLCDGTADCTDNSDEDAAACDASSTVTEAMPNSTSPSTPPSWPPSPAPSACSPEWASLLIPAAGRCDQYVVCYSGRSQTMACPGTLRFNYPLQTCDWPANVPCA